MTLRLVLAFCCIWLTSVAPDLRAAEIDERAVLLVATARLGDDPIYAQSVLIAAPAANGFHVGLIVNRPTQRSLASLFPSHEPSRRVKENVYFGGPMFLNALVALVRHDGAPGPESLPLAEGLYLAVGGPTVDRVIESFPDAARFFVGAVVWQPGELREELRRGFWTVLVADPELIFRADPMDLWQMLQRAQGAITAESGDPGGIPAPVPAMEPLGGRRHLVAGRGALRQGVQERGLSAGRLPRRSA